MITSTAAGTPAAGAVRASALNSHPSTEENMTSQINAKTAGSTACADFTLLSKNSIRLADQLGMEIIWFPDGFGALKDADILVDTCTPSELEHWLDGYENGTDDISIVTQIAHAKIVLDELVMAEQIIQTLTAQMSDEQRRAAFDSLVAAGFSVTGPARCKERGAAIAAARTDGVAS